MEEEKNILILDNEQSEFLEWLLNNYEKEYYFNKQDKTHAKVLLIKLFLSNLTTEESFKHKVDCADVNLLINSAFFDILLP